jgi:fructose-bisphosphate aldolase class II
MPKLSELVFRKLKIVRHDELNMETREILEKAKKENWALGAFNSGNVEILRAVVEAGNSLRSPLIVETSAGEAEHFGMKTFLGAVDNLREETGLPILTNFDHGPGLEECLNAIESGYNLVHFDGSRLPYEENVKITKALVEKAHEDGIMVEAEIDTIVGESQYHDEIPESIQAVANYTDPVRAAKFAEETGCDILAVFIGNLHGTYRQPPRLDIERLKLISQSTNCFLSLHGGSGLFEEHVKEAILAGIVKVNINTEVRLAYRQTLENVLKGSEEIAIYKLMPPVMAAVQKVVEEKMELFGSSGKASF